MSEILSLKLKDNHLARLNSSQIGQFGEELAARHLLKNRYRIVMANFKVPIGRNRRDALVTGEIDLIALDKDVLCFVEVKTRSSSEYSTPESAVNLRKQRQITRTAKVYRKIFQVSEMKARFDVISIVLANNAPPKIELFKGFWNENKFRKKIWIERF